MRDDESCYLNRVNMKLYTMLSFLLISFYSAVSVAAHTGGYIDKVRATTDSTIHGVESRNVIQFKLKTAYSKSCIWLQVEKNNSYFVSNLLAAQARGKKITVWYDDADGQVCETYTIEISE